MKDEDKSKEQLIRELNEARRLLSTHDNVSSPEQSDAGIDGLFPAEFSRIDIDNSQQPADKFIYEENKKVVDYLKKSRLFSHLPQQLLKQLNPLSELVEYPKGSVILKEGEKNVRIFFLVRGAVGIYAGSEFILDLQRKGDIFGEMSSISGKPCSATVKAETPIKLFSIKAREIGKYTDIDSDTLKHTFYRLFSMILTEKLAITTNKAQQYEITYRKMLKEVEDRRQAEIELVKYRDSLQQMVDERTAALVVANEQLQNEVAERKLAEEKRLILEEQLRQSQKMEAIGTLASGIAHDFNNILSTILGYTQLVSEHKRRDEDEQEYLEEIQKAGERATELVAQLLTFSRVGESDLKPLSLSEIVEEALKMMRATLPASIDIKQDFSNGKGTILANATQMQHIIVNLCSNAKDAMMDNGGTLTVHLEKARFKSKTYPYSILKKGTDYLKLTLEDTGCGITAENKDRIFEPFFTTKEVGDGSGLGLSVVHGIVRNHQGHIVVESELGVGTTFHMFFPIIKEPVSEVLKSEQVASAGNEHILIVEDEVSLAKFYRVALQNLGYQVTVAYGGKEALKLFKDNPHQYDLMFTDQTMPKMTGAQLSQEVLEIRPDIPIILATGYSSIISENKAIKLGIEQYMMKPVKLADLTRIIRNIFKTR